MDPKETTDPVVEPVGPRGLPVSPEPSGRAAEPADAEAETPGTASDSTPYSAAPRMNAAPAEPAAGASARPTGITILAVLAGIFGVFAVLGSLAIFGLGGVGLATAGVPGQVGGLVMIGALILLVSGVLALAFAYGAWNLRPWAWTLGVIAEVLSLVSSVLEILNGNAGQQIISILIALGILYYLFTPRVKAAFGRS